MLLQIESTGEYVEIDGVACRLWKGVTDQGTPCKVFVHRIAVRNDSDQSQFAELNEAAPPAVVRSLGNPAVV